MVHMNVMSRNNPLRNANDTFLIFQRRVLWFTPLNIWIAMKMKNEDIVGSRVLLPVAKYLLICCYEMRLEIVLRSADADCRCKKCTSSIVVIVVHASEPIGARRG